MAEPAPDLVLSPRAPSGGWLIPRRRARRDVSESRRVLLELERELNEGRQLSPVEGEGK